jgi:hypothetical protein
MFDFTNGFTFDNAPITESNSAKLYNCPIFCFMFRDAWSSENPVKMPGFSLFLFQL